jgi:hypothetical protein
LLLSYGCAVTLVSLWLEPHHMMRDRQGNRQGDRRLLISVCHHYDISITTHIDQYNERWRNHSYSIAVLILLISCLGRRQRLVLYQIIPYLWHTTKVPLLLY